MHHLLLSVHVLAAIVFVGGSAVATSLFPRYAPSAADSAPQRSTAVAAALHRITGTYARLGVLVPVAGIVLAILQERMGEIWITAAIILTGCAGAIILTVIHPMQREVMETPGSDTRLRTLGMLAGVYNTLWAIVVVLMIVRPGALT